MKHFYHFNFSKIATIFTFLFAYISPAYAQINLQSGLIACYPFSGNSTDATGNGNNGTSINGPVLVNDRFGKPNSAYKFDGVDDYISVSPNNFKNNNYTYSIWANINSLPSEGNNYAVWAIGNTNFSGAGDQFIMLGSNYVFTSQNGWYGGGYNSNDAVSLKAVGSLPNINTWYHLAVTRDKEYVTFYVDGQLVGSAATNGDLPRYGGSGASIEARIGNRSPTLGGQNFKGIIDDISIYNRALSELEIKALFNSTGCSPIPPPVKHLINTSPINTPPNVFTPNGDNINENFTIDYRGDGEFEMVIYNRWGKPITTIFDGKQGWDGSGCSTGIYFYSIKVEDKLFKGWVSLLR